MDVRLAMYQNEIEKIEDDMLPFGYYSDGATDMEDAEDDEKWSSGADHWLIFDKKNIPSPWDDLRPKKKRWS